MVWRRFGSSDARSDASTVDLEMLMTTLASVDDDEAWVVLQSHHGDQLDAAEEQRIKSKALYWACGRGSERVVDYVLGTGADPNASGDKFGRTPLFAACGKGQLEIVRLLLEAGADVDLATRDGRTPLHAACSIDDTEVVQLLLKAQADVNLADKGGWTPLWYASSTSGNGVVKLLLEAGADVNLATKLGQTPLHRACLGWYHETVKLLIEARADVNLPNKDGRSLLSDACRANRIGIARLLLEAGADVNRTDEDGRTLLFDACRNSRIGIARLLLEAGADVNWTDEDGRTLLFDACRDNRIEIVRLLLEAGADVNRTDEKGESPLHCAPTAIIAKLLISAGANPTTVDKYGWNPLHRFSVTLRHETASVLLACTSNLLLDRPDRDGYHPMHLVLFGIGRQGWTRKTPDTLQVLIEHGSEWDSMCDQIANQVVPWPSYLVDAQPTYNANNSRRREAAAVRFCVTRWIEEHKQGLPFTEVPLEVVRSGESATKVFIRESSNSRNVVIRSKICVVGPSNWGKTSLIKSLTTEMPSLVHSDDRTVGIDHFRLVFHERLEDQERTNSLAREMPWRRPVGTNHFRRASDERLEFLEDIEKAATFWDLAGQGAYQDVLDEWAEERETITSKMRFIVHPEKRTVNHQKGMLGERLDDRKVKRKHVVTFWDFAGQDAYQSAHSLFYSARTLYLVCIDLESYVLARMQAELMTDTESDADRWMNEFVDTKILRWIRVICACQPDAEFVFVATKKDRVVDADLEGDDGVLTDLRQRMANVMVIVDEMKRAPAKRTPNATVEPEAETEGRDMTNRLPITHLGDPRLAEMSMKPSVDIIVTSSKTSKRVQDFKVEIEDAIKRSGRGFPMPDKYSLVLKALLRMREEALASATDKRIVKTFRAIERLVQTLVKTIVEPFPSTEHQQGEKELYLDELTCRVILETLRDLGDVLWYDSIDDELLKNTIIVDPMLMIDLARDIFDHNHTGEVITHHTLKGLKHWRHLDGTASMLSMKRVMQNFHLVYPTAGDMSATSDLIVPAYWKTNTSAFWMFGGGDLRFGRGVHREDVAIRVHFEFQFVNNYPDTLFDHVVVASYSPFYKRDVGPDWIMYKEDNKVACRLMIGRDHKTHHPLLHLEALEGHPADEDQAEELWDIFTLVAESLEVVIRTYPGVVVCRYVREDTEKDVEQTRYTLETLQKFKFTRASRKWLPPKPTWESYLTFWKG